VNRRAWLARGLSAIVIPFVSACSTPALDDGRRQAEPQRWTGRLALNIGSEPPQSFFATFELKGSAVIGELTLTSPLGSVLAVIRWAPGEATLRTGTQTQGFDSMDSLTRNVTGTPVPVRALFEWLGGVNTAGGEWQADLSRLDQGRLSATRSEPAPAAELKLILDR
jgi:outer membrane lipoprotein LolB